MSSDLCPVYAPFFGAMVSATYSHRRSSFNTVPSDYNVHRRLESLHDRVRNQGSTSASAFCSRSKQPNLGLKPFGSLPALRNYQSELTSNLLPSLQGCTAAISLTCIGAAYGTAKSGVGISAMSILRPDLMMKCVVPVIMAGIIAIVSPERSPIIPLWVQTRGLLISGQHASVCSA